MKAVLCARLGGPDDLEIRDIPNPAAGAGEAVVKVEAASLNFFDTLIIAGKYQIKPDLPFSPAAEFAGTVESVGTGVTGIAAGDRVLGYSGYGAARERVAIPASRLVKLPPSLDADRAAGLAVTYGTSYYALKDRAGLKPGESLAVLGAAGGVGLAAVELGKAMGARVIACASSDEKLAFARRHGADDGVNYASENLRDGLKRLGGERGVDVIYDPVGGAQAEAALRAIAWEGRYLVVGFAAGEIPSCRSISCCSRVATCSAFFGAHGSIASRKLTAPTWPSLSRGARPGSCRPMSTPSIRLKRSPRPSRRSRTGR